MGMPYGAFALLEKTRLIQNLKSELVTCDNGTLDCLMMGRAKISLTGPQIEHVIKSNNGLDSGMLSGWSDQLLRHFGCDNVETLDFSDFEGAQFHWNLNESLGSKKRI